jgi:lipid-binding SYLF domain-containing protein
MSRLHSTLAAALAVSIVSLAACSAHARSEEETVRLSNEVLREFLDLRVKQIPASLLSEGHGVAIIPNVIKVGLVVGGQHGKGVIVAREPDGSWRAPMFISFTGGSIGWQVGAQATDIILVFKTQKSVENLMRGKFTLGADAAVAAGPVGRRTSAATDAELKAEIYSYSRSRGLFAGLSIDGSVLQVHDDLNAAYYGPVAPGAPPQRVPESALALVQSIAKLCATPEVGEAGIPFEPLPAAREPTLAAPQPTISQPSLAPQSVVTQPIVTQPIVTQPLAPQPFAPQPVQELEELRGELVKAVANLHPLLDNSWRRYLALPDEVSQRTKRPPADEVLATLRRFDAVAANPQYQALQERGEFQTAHGLLRAYYESLTAIASSKLSLPPPPRVPR